MALTNLSSSLIQDTYPKLLQQEGGNLADGSGSAVDTLNVTASNALFATNADQANNALTAATATTATNADFAVTATSASHAVNADSAITAISAGTATTADSASYVGDAMYTGSVSGNTLTFTKGDSSTFDIDLSGVSPDLSDLNAFTASADLRLDALETETGSLQSQILGNDNDISLLQASASTAASDIATNTSNITANDLRIDAIELETGSYARVDQDNSFTGTQTFNNIEVNGTGSFAYIQQITGSAKIIGDAYIILNNDTPAERFAGIVVQDSGSVGVTASLEFDGLYNDWFYEYSDDGGVTTDHGVVLFGPEYNTKGVPTYPTNNTIQKGNGGHHLLDSSITDDGVSVGVGLPLNVTGAVSASTFIGDGSGLTGVISSLAASQETGDIKFENIAGEIYGSAASPLTGNITVSVVSTKVDGSVAVIYHNDTTEPTINNATVDKKVGNYEISGLNVITLTNVNGTNILEYIAGAPIDTVDSASYATFAATAGTADTATTASYVLGSNVDGTVASATSASHALVADSLAGGIPVDTLDAVLTAGNTSSNSIELSTAGFTYLRVQDTSTGNQVDVNRDGMLMAGTGLSNPALVARNGSKLDLSATSHVDIGGSTTAYGGYVTINDLRYPDTDGTVGQFITTDGLGTLSWAAPGGVTSITAGTGISVDQSTGDVTISATGGGGAAGLINGTGTDSLASAASLTTTAAVASGLNSIALGEGTTANGDYTIAIGSSLTAGAGNQGSIAIGYDASSTNTQTIAMGMYTTATNYQAMAFGSTAAAEYFQSLAIGGSARGDADLSTAIGGGATIRGFAGIGIGNGTEAEGGSYQTAIGFRALAYGGNTVAIGREASTPYTAADTYNVAIGAFSKVTGTAGQGLAIGYLAEAGGSFGTAFGASSFTGTGDNNTAIGRNARTESTSVSSTAIGANATASGSNSLALGSNAKAEFSLSTAIGVDTVAKSSRGLAIGTNTTADGDFGIALGGQANTGTGHNNIALGRSATIVDGQQQSISIGSNTLNRGAYGVAIGAAAKAPNQSVAIGWNAFGAGSSTGGSENVAIGPRVAYNHTTGNGNVLIGHDSGQAQTNANHSVAIGYEALQQNVSGNQSVAVGLRAGKSGGGGNMVSTIQSVYIGADTKGGGATSQNEIVIGYNTTGTGNNTITLGNSNIVGAYTTVDWTITSDARDKTNFQAVPHGLDFVKNLTPTAYQYLDKREASENEDGVVTQPQAQGPLRYGFKAQDILALEGDNPVIVNNNNPDKLGLTQGNLIPVLVKAIQELEARVAALEGNS